MVKVKNLQILIHNNFLKRLFWKSPRQINQILYPFKGFKLNWTAIEVEPVDCECSDIGTEEKNCESETEQCKCKPNFTGEKCEEPACDCDETGTEEKTCQSEAEKCKCKPNYTGEKCGKCKPNFTGEKCDECSGDYWMSSKGKFNSTKGQLISEWIYEVILSPKIQTKKCQNFCPVYLVRAETMTS